MTTLACVAELPAAEQEHSPREAGHVPAAGVTKSTRNTAPRGRDVFCGPRASGLPS